MIADTGFLTLAIDVESSVPAMLFTVLGGLGIFLLGMKHLSEGMQAISGNTLRRMISGVTDNRFLAVGTGTAVTCVVQSSSITTVLVVAFVNSGLMALHQAIGVIMGANIGTTITGWILVLKVGKYGLPILGAAAIVYLFSRRERLRFAAMAIMGTGMVFFGLDLMSSGFKPIREIEAFRNAFLWFEVDGYFDVLKCAMVGCCLTLIVQSSSATLGITMGLASTGAIGFETAAALVLGENIGTTITAVLASIGTTTNAKRAAWAHVIFNVVGVLWITALYRPYFHLIDQITAWETGHRIIGLSIDALPEGMTEGDFGVISRFAIAATHTGFNVVNVLLGIGLVRVWARMLERLISGPKEKELGHLSSLDFGLIETPLLAIEQSRVEMGRMFKMASKMMSNTAEILFRGETDSARIEKVFEKENILDTMEFEMVTFLSHLLASSQPSGIVEESRSQLRAADEIESIGDTLTAIVKTELKVREANLSFTDQQRKDLEALHNLATENFALVSGTFEKADEAALARARAQGQAITRLAKDLREGHLNSLTLQRVDPVVSTSYLTILMNYRRLKDHCLNIAEAAAGEK